MGMGIKEMLERLKTGQIAVVKTDCAEKLGREIERHTQEEVYTVRLPEEGEYIRFINGLAATLIQKALFRNCWEGIVLIDAGDGGHGDRFAALLELLSLTTTGRWIVCTKAELSPMELKALMRFGIPFCAGYAASGNSATDEIKKKIEAYAAQRGLALRANAADRLAQIAQEVQESPVFSQEMLVDSIVVGIQQKIVTAKMVDLATGEGTYAALCRATMEKARSRRRTLGFTTDEQEEKTERSGYREENIYVA